MIEQGRLKRVEPVINLKMETYDKMDSMKAVDPSLKLGTGDDEIVDIIIKATKVGMGSIGALFNGDTISQAVKSNSRARKSVVNS